MKIFLLPPLRVILRSRFHAGLLIRFLLLILFSAPIPLWAISLTGANGRAVEFHLIESATPKGLTARMAPDGPVIGIAWDKLDLGALERDHKAIHDAYLRAQQGETVTLNLSQDTPGAMPAPGGAPAPSAAPAATPAPERFPGWIETKSGPFVFLMQLPAEPARGILLLSYGQYGQSFERFVEHQRGSGVWGAFQNKHHLALLAYDFSEGKLPSDPTVIEDFVFAKKGSGKALEAAIKALAAKTKQPALADLPIAIYGAERTGAAFAYHFLQYHPERVIAAVISKGAFYDGEPSSTSVQVPVLYIWGEYCNNPERWGSANHATTVLEKAAAFHPNWTNGREYRGQCDQTPVVEHFGKQYLLEMVKARLPEKKEAGKGESKPAEEGATAAGSENFGLIPLDRAKGSKGNVETGEAIHLTDPDQALAAEETFLPNDAVAKLWKAFVLGELEAPASPQTPP